MPDAARDRERWSCSGCSEPGVADRLRPPWWYLAGFAIMYALVFAFPSPRGYLGVGIWPFLVAALAVAAPMQWAWTRTTGIKMGFGTSAIPARAVPRGTRCSW